MGDHINRNSGGSAKSEQDKRVSHQFNRKYVENYIIKGLKVLRPFAEFLRLSAECHQPLASQITKIRDICSHKFETLSIDQLISMASTMKWLDSKFEMELSSLKLHDQISPTFYNMIVLNKFVMMDFISRNIHIFGEEKGCKWLKNVGLEGDTYQDMMENADISSTPPPFSIDSDDEVWLRNQITLFDKLIF